MADLTRHRGFEVVSVCCKVCGIPKEYLGLSSGEKLEPTSFEAMCNPIGQAKVLSREGTDLNGLLGLCVGHDSLFFKYADAWTTVLATKDRLLGHNALAALYTIESYYKVLESLSEHHKNERKRGGTMLEKLLFLCLSSAGVFLFPYLWGCAMGTALPSFTLHPIGYVKKEGDKTRLVVNEAYKDGLLGLEDFSHVYVYFWFDKNDTPEKREILRVHPMADPNNPLTGVFATRSPVRPNLIGMTLSRVLSIEGNIIEIDWTDALENTPILDIKPFIRAIDCAEPSKLPVWLEGDGWVKGPQGAHRDKDKQNRQL